jgi:5-methylcytosine-specific restriction endonuclease McrA
VPGVSRWANERTGLRVKLRAELGRLVASGEARCALCGSMIAPGSQWDVDHLIPQDVDDSDGMTWGRENLRATHRRCNRSAGARYRNKKHPGARRPAVRACPGCGAPIPATSFEWLCRSCTAVVAGQFQPG